MVTYKSFNNIVLDILNYLRLTQPSLDTKPASVARDLFVDAQAQQVSIIYDAIKNVAAMQSVANLTGQDLTNYGSNYGISRQTGTKAYGNVVLTFKSLSSDVPIPQNSIVRTRNGIPFLTVSSTTVTTSQANSLRATATRLRQQLNTAGITDTFAIEVSVQTQSTGSVGNISSYSIVSQNISGVSNVTNVSPFTGGTNLEDDVAFRARILATFSSANIGTALCYRSIILNLADAIDALVIEPGDPLMTRDGTVTTVDSYGNTIVSKPGTGGRIDIYVMGENLQPATDSFVYYDQSGTGDASDPANNFVLGQSNLTASTSLTLNSRRVATLSEGAAIPNQPVSKITSVSGSLSGTNFVEQYLDTTTGQYKGNYKLIKDTGSAGGSSFGLDKFAWTSSYIDLSDESSTKGQFNSVDSLAYTEISELTGITQDIQITNENSSVQNSSRSYITTKHKPVRTVSRIFNLTTGERYIILDQNPDGTGNLNTTGRIKISGSTLPTVSDILQVDYTWVFPYDKYVDFDNLNPRDPLDSTQDSVEWGYSNYIRDEISQAILDSYGNLMVKTLYPISRILSVNIFKSETLVVAIDKTITTTDSVSNVYSIKDASLTGEPEVYNTKENDGKFSYRVITLPTDTLARAGDIVSVIYNLNNIAEVDGYDSGLFVNNDIYILPNTIVTSGTFVRVNYVANISNVIPTSTQIANFPISGDGFNSFVDVDGYQPALNSFSGTVITANQRRSPSNLVVTLSNIPTTGGSIRIVGTTINKVTGILTATADNTIDLYGLIKSAEGTSSIPNIYVVRVTKIDKVTTNISGAISSTDFEYDLTNYAIRDTRWDIAHSIENSNISMTGVRLASTTYNNSSTIVTGTKLLVTFYYAKPNDYEDLYFSRSGKAITNKRFGYISSINRISGLQDSGGTIIGSVQIDTLNQPTINETYLTSYIYKAPKDNERITINYEYNKLIVDATTAVEQKRPITADVLEKAASKIEVDVSAVIIVSNAYKDQKSTVKQDVSDNITSALTATALGTTIDSSDIIDSVYNVQGVDRVRITRFNKTGVLGTKLSIVAQKNEYIAPGIVTVSTEER
ncbi:MAG: baseplate J/gp47 family protein [Patescibacteria group bacterium]|jgi:hypothetical protein